MAEDMKARQLIKQVPQVVAALEFVGTDTITINPTLSGSGWEVIDDGSKLHLVWRGYIDLAGYTRDELTFFTQAVDVQHGSLDTAGPTVLSSCHKDLITTRRIRDDEISLYTGTLSFSNTLDIQEIVYGEWTNFVPYATTYPSLRPTTGGTFGTGNPSAADRLHITRILSTEGSGSESVIFAGTNYLIGGVTGQEKELVYIERLRRAYTQDPGRNI